MISTRSLQWVILCLLIFAVLLQLYYNEILNSYFPTFFFYKKWFSFDNETTTYSSKKNLNTIEKPMCSEIPLYLGVEINLNLLPLEEVEKLLPDDIQLGGLYNPQLCTARSLVAIIVPYRNRFNHLGIFLNHMHRFLRKQQIKYGIFIIEESDNNPFNRGKLFNVGFKEAFKIKPFDCFIFHDIDYLPINNRNLYYCSDQPKHFSAAIDKFGYKLPYKRYFGGVSGFKKEQFELINGFSNLFWGWGGEDDDLWNRVHYFGLNVTRSSAEIGKYISLDHEVPKKNPIRYKLLAENKKHFKTDGLNSLHYEVKDVQLRKLYTWISVDLGNKSLKT